MPVNLREVVLASIISKTLYLFNVQLADLITIKDFFALSLTVISLISVIVRKHNMIQIVFIFIFKYSLLLCVILRMDFHRHFPL